MSHPRILLVFLTGILVGMALVIVLFHRPAMHHGATTGTSVAEESSRHIRILCLVLTSPEHHYTRAVHVQATWGKRCTKLLFLSEGNDTSLPIIHVNVKAGRQYLTVKQRIGWDHVYRHHFNDADWFFKVDDDAYVIMENLRHFLSTKNTDEPVYFGHHFKILVQPDGYFSGGCGYVLSKEALRRFGARSPGVYREEIESAEEDVEMGYAMQKLGVKAGDSRDESGLIRFYTDKPEDFLLGPIPNWLYNYDKYTPIKGIDNVSQSAIAFHHLTVAHMYSMEYFIYRLQPHGLH